MSTVKKKLRKDHDEIDARALWNGIRSFDLGNRGECFLFPLRDRR